MFPGKQESSGSNICLQYGSFKRIVGMCDLTYISLYHQLFAVTKIAISAKAQHLF